MKMNVCNRWARNPRPILTSIDLVNEKTVIYTVPSRIFGTLISEHSSYSLSNVVFTQQVKKIH